MYLLLLLAACVFKVTAVVEWNYKTVEDSGKFCPERDSCNYGRSSRGSLDLDWRSRNCLCDHECSTYGDCCIDARAFNAEEQKENYKKFSCSELRQYGAVYMRTQCLADWSMPNIRAACEESSQKSDPVGSMPVTSKATGITYKNYYCAVCNHASADVQFWKPRLECPTLKGYNSRFNNITKSFLMDNLKYSKGQWGVEFDTLGVPVFHACYFDPFLPDILEPVIRSCNSYDAVSSCPPSYDDTDTAQLCQSYTGLVFAGDQVYRNTHCAVCNNVSTDSLICIKLEGRRLGFFRDFKPHSFAVLFDIAGSDGEQVGVTDKCLDGEIWDPFAKKCRNVICGEEGNVFVDGKCYKDGEDATTTTSTSTTTTTTTTTTSTTTITSTTTTTTSTPTTATTTTTPTSTEVSSDTTTSTTTQTTVSVSSSTLDKSTAGTTTSKVIKTTARSNSKIVFPSEIISVNVPIESENASLAVTQATTTNKPTTTITAAAPTTTTTISTTSTVTVV